MWGGGGGGGEGGWLEFFNFKGAVWPKRGGAPELF